MNQVVNVCHAVQDVHHVQAQTVAISAHNTLPLIMANVYANSTIKSQPDQLKDISILTSLT